ncbi:MAG TPA: phosphoribosylamine--glycine ligase [Candidatus Excrementavichristensenella intestinipullorum]|nr:phosphoribosylamine--glycine ligase [Candidatus Excrementavichristensenella intestinipullorum]
MDILVIGGGGREHAIVEKLRQNPEVETIYALPGNGGIAAQAQCVDIKATDIEGIVGFAQSHKVDFAVVAPDDPLALGAVDRLEALGIPCFGPNKAAARIEASKVFAKGLMEKYHIPTAKCRVFHQAQEALNYVDSCPLPTVVKADGLALGKGVLICQTREEAREAVQAMMVDKRFGDSGSRVVVEEFLQGPEVSVLAFTDGKTIKPMVSSMDHKRAGDGDTGLNTGGMGTIAPNPLYTPEIAQRCMEEIFLPTIRAMAQEGCPFKGCLYFGLMLTQDGPKVIEYNCRFGDPETQVVLPLMTSDLLSVMQAVAAGNLADTPVEFSKGAACCVMVVSGGYPGAYAKGKAIDVGGAEQVPGATLYHSGTALDAQGRLVTAGGRVLGACGVGPTLEQAIHTAYQAAEQIRFQGAFMRRDIGKKALELARLQA